ncbi:MAG: L,D-transpeptidase, partial [Solirubrobacterales bacterium]|nr:L,D-transpeptidase [Solirubrobacterales bacterium]
SHGCIRLRNAAIITLGQLMPVGTPVTIECAFGRISPPRLALAVLR